MSANQTRSDAIYASLRRAILEQALQPGVKLPEDTIGETFGASRTSARNALIRLASEGLVEIRPNRGAAVAMPSLEDAHEVFDIRQRLENLVISRLCERMPKDGIESLRAHVREEELAIQASSPRSIRLSGEFHVLLAELTKSKLLINFMNQLVSQSSLILARFGRPHSAKCAVDEHIELIEALQARDAKRAIAIMGEHLHAVADRAEIGRDTADVGSILSHYADAGGMA